MFFAVPRTSRYTRVSATIITESARAPVLGSRPLSSAIESPNKRKKTPVRVQQTTERLVVLVVAANKPEQLHLDSCARGQKLLIELRSFDRNYARRSAKDQGGDGAQSNPGDDCVHILTRAISNGHTLQ